MMRTKRLSRKFSRLLSAASHRGYQVPFPFTGEVIIALLPPKRTPEDVKKPEVAGGWAPTQNFARRSKNQNAASVPMAYGAAPSA